MPYNIPGETPEMTKKMESCVNDLMADPNFKPREGQDKKSAAIAVCKATMMGTAKRGRENYKVSKEAIK